jgi:hypothetical protein
LRAEFLRCAIVLPSNKRRPPWKGENFSPTRITRWTIQSGLRVCFRIANGLINPIEQLRVGIFPSDALVLRLAWAGCKRILETVRADAPDPPGFKDRAAAASMTRANVLCENVIPAGLLGVKTIENSVFAGENEDSKGNRIRSTKTNQRPKIAFLKGF